MRGPRRVVITGLGIVSPIGIGKDAFWENLIAGKSGVDYVRAFDASQYASKVAAEVKDFNGRDFVSSRRVKMMGRFSLLALAATRLALQDSGLSITSSLSSKTTICYGTSVAGLELAAAGVEDFVARGPGAMRPWTAIEYPSHASTSYLSIEFGITGPSISMSSNCCTGIDAIQAAANQIAQGQMIAALAGACDAPIFPAIFDAFCVTGQLTKRTEQPEKASRPYDLLRDGAVLAEGAATLVLEERDFALDRGATIYAEILGYAGASEGIGMRKPDLSGQALAVAIRHALSEADVSTHDIDHVNAHGSSVPDFDVCDTAAFKSVFGQRAYSIPITSIKSAIGQPISAAGVLQTAAASLSLRHQMLSPTINQEVPDPQCDLDYVANRRRVARLNTVLINVHSTGGSVAALVVGRRDH